MAKLGILLCAGIISMSGGNAVFILFKVDGAVFIVICRMGIDRCSIFQCAAILSAYALLQGAAIIQLPPLPR